MRDAKTEQESYGQERLDGVLRDFSDGQRERETRLFQKFGVPEFLALGLLGGTISGQIVGLFNALRGGDYSISYLNFAAGPALGMQVGMMLWSIKTLLMG